VRLAGVDVEEEGAVRGEDAPRLFEARREEPEIVIERVLPGAAAEHLGPVPLALEPGAVPGVVADGAQARAALLSARVERRVDVDEAREAVGQRAQDVEVVAEDDAAARDLAGVERSHRVTRRVRRPVGPRRSGSPPRRRTRAGDRRLPWRRPSSWGTPRGCRRAVGP